MTKTVVQTKLNIAKSLLGR